MTEVELNILREKNQTPFLQAIGQELPNASGAVTQLSLDGVFDAHAIGLVIIDQDAILRVWEVLNEVYKDSATTESLDCHGRRNSQ